jgi:hypothetical protein
MSRIEDAAKSAMTPLLLDKRRDVVAPLDKAVQIAISMWAIKTAMVAETAAPPPPKAGTYFYTQNECEALCLSSSIPARTIIWLGRFSGIGLWQSGTHIWSQARNVVPKDIHHGCVSTLILNHLAIQVLTMHVFPEGSAASVPVSENNAPGDFPWSDFVIPLWPLADTIWWPPPKTFTESGPLGVAALIMRLKTGRKA